MFFGSKIPKQELLVLTETKQIEFRDLPTDVLYAASMGSIQAWELDPNQQAQREKSGNFVQVVSERSKKPLTVFRNRPRIEGRSTETIASLKQDEELAFVQTRSHKNSILLWLAIITALLTLTFCLAVGIPLIKEGLAFAPGLAILSRRKKQAEGVISNKDDINRMTGLRAGVVSAYIFVDSTGEMIEREIDRANVPDGAIERKLGKIPFYVLGLNNNGEFWAIEPSNKIEENDSPTDLFLALQYEQEVDAFYGMDERVGEKIKFGIFIGLIILIVIVLTLMGISVLGA